MMGVSFAGYQGFFFSEVPNGTLSSETSLRADFVEVQVPGGSGKPALHPAGATWSYVLSQVNLRMEEL